MTFDLNNDQQDDIISFDDGKRLVVNLNNGLKRSWQKILGPFVGVTWAGIVADFNNDGLKEIVVGTDDAPFRIYTYDYVNESFTLYYQFDKVFLMQNMNSVDLNNDGWLDLFLCNDNGENYTLLNDGEGNLVEQKAIDYSTIPETNMSGNYGSVFLDFDLDGDQDLYISKCSILADSPSDPRRINQFFINDGNNNFTNKAEELGLDFGQQTWVADFADLDLDGDNDLIVANHGDDLILLRNNGIDGFEEMQENSGIQLQNDFWQLSYADLDNDGYQDVIITADDLYIYRNNGDFTFTPVVIGDESANFGEYSMTIGDYNNDGFLDIYVDYGISLAGGPKPDSILINQKNNNNWIIIDLEGVESNIDGVGATAYCYSENKTQLYQVKAGHSYGIQNHGKVHFGLGLEVVDSIKIVWPSGQIDMLISPEINQSHFVTEGLNCHLVVQSTVIVNNELCAGEALEISLTDGNIISWANGSLENEILYDKDEIIFATYGESDCTLESWKVFPDYIDTSTIITSTEIYAGFYLPCPEEVINIDLPGNDHKWSNGNEGSSYLSENEEDFIVKYSLTCTDVEESFSRVDLAWDFDAPDTPIPFNIGENVTVNVTNPYTKWYNHWTDEEPFFIGKEYIFEGLTEDKEYFLQNDYQTSYASSVGLEESTNASAPGSAVNPVVKFKIHEAITLKSIDVETEIAGSRQFQITTDDLLILFDKVIDVELGKTTLEINLDLLPGDYKIMTNPLTNQSSFGVNGPLLFREIMEGQAYPFLDELGALEIVGHEFINQQTYYSFYNWIVEAPAKYCEGERTSLLLRTSLAAESDQHSFIQFNNPVQSSMKIKYEGEAEIKLIDLNGQLLLNTVKSEHLEIDMTSYTPGMYLLFVNQEAYRVVKI